MIKILRIGGLLTIPRCTFQRRGVAETCGAVLSRQPQTFASRLLNISQRVSIKLWSPLFYVLIIE